MATGGARGGAASAPEAGAGDDGVPDRLRCPICLGAFTRRALVEGCLHCFCFRCILAWTDVTPACPLCKAPCEALLTDLVSEYEYNRFVVASRTLQRGAGVGRRGLSRAQLRRRQVYLRKSHAFPPGHERHGAETEGAGEAEAIEARDEAPPFPAPALTSSRARSMGPLLEAWLRRELRAILHTNDVAIPVAVIAGALLDAGSRDATARATAASLLHDRASHFLHEVEAFAASGLSIEAYDRAVAYPPDQPAVSVEARSDESSAAAGAGAGDAAGDSSRAPKRVRRSASDGAADSGAAGADEAADAQLAQHRARADVLYKLRAERDELAKQIEAEHDNLHKLTRGEAAKRARE